MKRPFTLTSAIINIVVTSLTIIGSLIVIFLFPQIVDLVPEAKEFATILTGVILYIFFLICVIPMGATLICSILMLSSWKKEATSYRFGLAIAVFVLDCVMVILNFALTNIYSIIIILLYAIPAVFIMLDIVKVYKERKAKNQINMEDNLNNLEENHQKNSAENE